MPTRGKYIVIEGNDGTGKSTQVELLADWLHAEKGIESFVAHEPAGTPIADALRTIIKDGTLPRTPETNVLLFTAARHEIWQEAKQALVQGKWVISARNYVSTLAYQGYGEGLDLEMINDLTRQFTGEDYMKPDLTVILTLDDQQTREGRISDRDGAVDTKDTFESRPTEYQSRVNEGYRNIAVERGYMTIEAAEAIEHIHQLVTAEVKKLV